MQIAHCYNYKGHTIYSDGRVYQYGELLIHCKSETSAKRWATINRRKQLAERATEHHNLILKINGKG